MFFINYFLSLDFCFIETWKRPLLGYLETIYGNIFCCDIYVYFLNNYFHYRLYFLNVCDLERNNQSFTHIWGISEKERL